MELSFNVAERLGFPKSTGLSMGKVPPDLLADLADAIDALSEQSAIVRELKTEYEDNRLPKLQSSEDTVYVIAEDYDLLGFVRLGVRSIKISATDSAKPKSGGYAAYTGSLKEACPCCLFDFFIAGGYIRRGLGILLFEAMLQGEGGLDPGKVAYSRPSDSMFSFLFKHYGLQGGRTVSSFTLFDVFFDESATVQRRQSALEVNARHPAEQAESDEPVIEEVEVLDRDPLEPYKKDEEEFYGQRTKLFCFNANEWQDAGAGQVSLLKNKFTGRVRLAFVQEAGKRVIANHFIINKAGFCELERHSAGNDKTWTWTAQERVLERRFALKFKTADDAAKFKDLFVNVKRRCVENDPVEYVIIRKVGATSESSICSKHVQLLAVDAIVNVVDVAYLADEKRVRARLVQPEGWITIMSHSKSDAGTYAVMRSDLDDYCSRKADGKTERPTGTSS